MRRSGGGGRRRQGRQQQVEQPLFGALLGGGIDVILALRTHHVDRNVHQLAHHRFDVAADVADLGELRCLDLEKRRTREPRETARDLGFAHARRTDHDDVVRHDLVADLFGRLRAPPAVTHRDGNGFFGGFLTHDVAIQLGDDLPRRHLLQPGNRILAGGRRRGGRGRRRRNFWW